jgi:hypothetical protein
VTDQENGSVDLADHSLEVFAVAAGQSAQRIGGAIIVTPSPRSSLYRARMLDASANAPWTRTMVGSEPAHD